MLLILLLQWLNTSHPGNNEKWVKGIPDEVADSLVLAMGRSSARSTNSHTFIFVTSFFGRQGIPFPSRTRSPEPVVEVRGSRDWSTHFRMLSVGGQVVFGMMLPLARDMPLMVLTDPLELALDHTSRPALPAGSSPNAPAVVVMAAKEKRRSDRARAMTTRNAHLGRYARAAFTEASPRLAWPRALAAHAYIH